jgi:hypothetical protein
MRTRSLPQVWRWLGAAAASLALLGRAPAGAASPAEAAFPPGAGSPAGAASRPGPDLPDRVQLRLDSSEAEAVLAILDRRNTGGEIRDETWQRLFASDPYVRLKKREAFMHREFSDDDFRAFVLSKDLAPRAAELRRTLLAWMQSDLAASAARVLAYLPREATIRAAVFPVIKPQTNSFVFEPATDAAIFLYLDPAESAAKFDNTVAHELHHIGFSSLSAADADRFKGLAPEVRTALDWMSGFGEGFAMLAAAGGPDVHPHASSPPAERARWDKDMTHFNRDLGKVQKFFLDILAGRLKTDDEIGKVGYSFFGVQGPWYTVGYRMAVVIERRYGRVILIDCMRDPRELLSRYNAAAAQGNDAGHGRLALWSPELLKRIGAGT